MYDYALTFMAKLKALFQQRRAESAFDEEVWTASCVTTPASCRGPGTLIPGG